MLADNAGMETRLDHLVILATSLEEGVRWCEQTLGVIPGPGGSHPLMGTHNRLVRIGSANFPDAYLEIIAIEPGVKPQRGAHQRRWFELDDPALADQIRHNGPQLAHWVARTATLSQVVQAWHTLGIDRGQSCTRRVRRSEAAASKARGVSGGWRVDCARGFCPVPLKPEA